MTLRPQSLAEVAERAENLQSFGWEFQDWLHTVRATRSRLALSQSIDKKPAQLKDRFPEGRIADAWLAAYAEHAAKLAGIEVPRWALHSNRILSEPWFSVESSEERRLALRDSPSAFRKRNLFTPLVDLPLRLRVGRPPKALEEKRRANAERQRRFRARRAVELQLLREVAADE